MGSHTQGRFPSHLIYDGSDEVMELFPGEKEKSASRFFYAAKPSRRERNMGCKGLEEKQYSHDGRNKTIKNPYQRNKSVANNHHPTVKAIALMEYLVKMITPKGGIVLDPFAGSGSTLIAAKQNGFDFIGMDLTPEYVEIAKARLKSVTKPII
jgi:site-specific DNA-methyltransferase (adenine-specific)